MGDSAVAEVTGEVVMEQASSTQTVTKVLKLYCKISSIYFYVTVSSKITH